MSSTLAQGCNETKMKDIEDNKIIVFYTNLLQFTQNLKDDDALPLAQYSTIYTDPSFVLLIQYNGTIPPVPDLENKLH